MIRPGTVDDFDQIVVVRTSVRENHLSVEQMASFGITPKSISARLNDGSLGCWVADIDGRIVGFSMAERDTASVFALFVLPEEEGKGHGSKLLEAVENWLRGLGHRAAHLSTEPGTRAFEFYRRKGWVETGEVSNFSERTGCCAKC